MNCGRELQKPVPIKLKVPSKEELAKKDPNEYTEVDKMVSSQLFDLFDPVLFNGMAFAKTMLRKINILSDPLDTDGRQQMFAELLGTFCKQTDEIESPFTCDYGSNIHLGKDVFINYGCVLLDQNEIRIGDKTLIGPGVHIYTGNHSLDTERRLDIYVKPVTIGKNVWIGGNSTILAGVSIGDGCTIGAGSVVTKDIEAYSVAVGSPARVIKKIDRPKENSS